MTSIEAPSSRRMLEDERAERLGLALGDAGGGLVEAEHPGVEGEQAGQLDDAAGAGGEVDDVGVGVAAEPEEVDELVGLGPRGAARVRIARGRTERGREDPVRPRASRATWTVSRTVSSGNSVAAWNVRPSPSRARSAADCR